MADTKAVATVAEKGGEVSTDVVDWDAIEIPDDGTDDAPIKPVFPKLQIVQNTSKIEGKKGHDGEFYLSGEKEFVNGSLDAVILQGQYNRVLFGEGDAPLCSSPDGIAPRPDSPLWQSQTFKIKGGAEVDVPHAEPRHCGQCLLKEFRNGAKPYCGDGYLLLLDLNANPEDMDLVQFRIGSTALKPFYNFKGTLKAKKGPKGRVGLPMFSHSVTLRTEETPGKSGNYYQLEIDWDRLPDRTFAAYAGVVGAIRADWQRTVAQTDFEGEGPGDEAGGGGGWGDGSEPVTRQARGGGQQEPPMPPPSDDGGWADGDE